MFLAGLLITTPILLHFYWYKKNPTEKRRYALNNIEAWLFWAAANLIVSWWLALIVDLVPVVFLTLISIGWGHISEGVKGSIELFNGIKDTVKPIFYAASMWVSWVIIFESIFKLYNDGDPDASKAAYTQRVRNFLFSFRADNCKPFHLTSFYFGHCFSFRCTKSFGSCSSWLLSSAFKE